MAINFVLRRLQPCKERVVAADEYAGKADMAREAPERVEKGDAYYRLYEFFTNGTRISNVGFQRAYDITNPPPPVRVSFCSLRRCIGEVPT